jgi:hypothetical protein
MRNLLLSDLKLGLADLLGTRAQPLLATTAGTLYSPALARLRTAIDALPAALTRDRPLVEEMTRTDAEHDSFGAAIWYYTEAVLRAPDTDPQTRARVERVRAAFIPTLGILRESYASEAAGATERRPKIEVFRHDLEQLPLPDGRSLADWVEAFVGRGETLLALLRRRATMAADQDAATRRQAGTLRSEAIATLMRLRTALADEFADRPALARDRDREIFAFVDQLAGNRNAALRSRVSADKSKDDTVDPEEATIAPDDGPVPAILPTG